MIHVLIINGVARSGKDSFVDDLAYLSNVVERISTIDAVKEIASQMGCDVTNKTDETRKFLSDLKMLWTAYNDGIFKQITQTIDRHFLNPNPPAGDQIVTVMCREPREIGRFVEYYGTRACKTVLVERSGIIVPDNDGDNGVNGYSYDYVISNDGDLTNLSEKAIAFLSDLPYKK